MQPRAIISAASLLGASVLAGCGVAAPDQTAFAPSYKGVETRLMDGDLVNFRVAMQGARDNDDVSAYAECAAAQYALIRDYGFARHLRTNVTQQGGLWRGDAVYTISAQLPRGMQTIDAEVVVAHCAENGIPTV
jgi:hypothetical protein